LRLATSPVWTGSFLQRSGSDDLKAALLAAGHAFMAAHCLVLDQVNAETSIYLPAGPGAFAATIVGASAGTRRYVYARARTWVHNNMLGQDQCLLAPAANPEDTVAFALWNRRRDDAVNAA
jgi:hypothetical protein